MTRRITALCLGLLALFLLRPCAADSSVLIVCGVEETAAPVYAGPSGLTAVTAYALHGMPAETADRGSGYVRILADGGIDGWVTADHVMPADGAGVQAETGAVRPCGAIRYRTLYAAPDAASEAAAGIEVHVPLTLLAASADGAWLLVRPADGTAGWMRAQDVRTGGERLWVDAAGAEERLHLRAEPSPHGASLGSYFAGTAVEVLFDAMPTDGWTHVAVLDRGGWMRTDYLRETLSRWLPPLVRMDSDSRLWSLPEDHSALLEAVSEGTAAEVLGLTNYWAHIRLRDGRSGWVPQRGWSRPPAAAGSIAILLDSALILHGADGSVAAGLPAGSEVTLTDSRPWAEWAFTDGAMRLTEPETAAVRADGRDGVIEAGLVWTPPDPPADE